MKRIIGIGATVAVIVFFKMFAAKTAQPIDSTQFRTDFIKASIESCLGFQTKAPENKDLTIRQLTSYCTCMAKAEADNFSPADYKLVNDSKPVIPPSIQTRINEMAPACIADITKDMHK